MMRRILPVLCLVLSLGACATGEGSTPGDPLEPSNRAMLDVNLAVDDAVIKPVAQGYRAVLPAEVRQGIRNIIDNIQEPRVLANNILQGRLLDAGHTTLRFLFNSTIGLGGIFDVATDFGIARRSGDFGQTLHVWGLDSGPFLMLPFAGPSNVRDTVGMVADGFLNPISWVMPFEGNLARGVVDGVDLRERNIENLETLQSGSLDFYARLRSVWQQRREAELGVTGAPDGEAAPVDVLDDPDAGPALRVPDDPGAAPALPGAPLAAIPAAASPSVAADPPRAWRRRHPATARRIRNGATPAR